MTKIRRSARAFLACVATLVACLAMMFAGIPTGSIKQAQAAGPAPIPANDQFPAPNPVYTEDFENNVNATGTPSSIDGYRAESDTPRYTAGNYWKDPNVCNGFIASANNQITLNAIRDTYCGPNSSDTYNNNGTQKIHGAEQMPTMQLYVPRHLHLPR
ncbi:MAG: hypothetical protein LKI78_03795 [Bifidobacterium tibiigranuli]|nr:hypothetical protein [Bifidobacterium tibiigranuli]